MRTLMISWIVVLVAGLAPQAPADEDSTPDSSDPAAMFGELDANGDGQLSADEVPQEHRRLFDRLLRTADHDADGQLSSQEFAAGLSPEADDDSGLPDAARQRRDRPADGRGAAKELFGRLDRNGDGKVTLDEVPEERREGFARLVERGDKDGDKALDAEEFAQAFPGGRDRRAQPDGAKLPQQRPGGRPDASRFFGRLDANGDGKVTLGEVPEERREGFSQLVKRADKDGDEALSLEEFSAVGRPREQPEGRPGQRPGDRPERPGRRPPGDRPGPPPGLFGALDADGDGTLSDEEISGAPAAIRRLDTDGDGRVTIEELMKAGRGRRNRD